LFYNRVKSLSTLRGFPEAAGYEQIITNPKLIVLSLFETLNLGK